MWSWKWTASWWLNVNTVLQFTVVAVCLSDDEVKVI